MRMFVGLDVHKKYTEVAIVDEEGVVEKRERIENEPTLIEEFSNKASKKICEEALNDENARLLMRANNLSDIL
jgi:predicted NBD/HSP70 family sugar kinase